MSVPILPLRLLYMRHSFATDIIIRRFAVLTSQGAQFYELVKVDLYNIINVQTLKNDMYLC